MFMLRVIKLVQKVKWGFNSFVILNLIFKNNLIVKITKWTLCISTFSWFKKIFGSKKTFSHDNKATHIYSKKSKKI